MYMFLKKYLDTLYAYSTSDMDFQSICDVLNLDENEIDDILNDKQSVEVLFDDFNIIIDLFDNINELFNVKNTMKFIRAIYKHKLEKEPIFIDKLDDFVERFDACYEDYSSRLKNYKIELTRIGVF